MEDAQTIILKDCVAPPQHWTVTCNEKRGFSGNGMRHLTHVRDVLHKSRAVEQRGQFSFESLNRRILRFQLAKPLRRHSTALLLLFVRRAMNLVVDFFRHAEHDAVLEPVGLKHSRVLGVRSAMADQVEQDVCIDHGQETLRRILPRSSLREEVFVVVIKPPIVQERAVRTATLLGMANSETKPLPHIVDAVVTTAPQTYAKKMTGSFLEGIDEQSRNTLTLEPRSRGQMNNGGTIPCHTI